MPISAGTTETSRGIAKQYLWASVELGFLTVLAVVLVYLIIGREPGVFVSGVADIAGSGA